MSAITKLHTLAWFAARPHFWGHLAALAARKSRADHDAPAPRAEATAWAAARAVPEEEALAAVGLPPQGDDGAADRLAALMGEGEELASKAEVKMGGPGATGFLFEAVRRLGAKRVVETGVAYGWSSLATLAALEETDGRLTSVDMPYPKMGNERWVGVAVPERLRHRWTLIRRPDRYGVTAAIKDQGGTLDLCHYDSDKSYWGRAWAFPKLWSALRPGGLFISDDIQDNAFFREWSEGLGGEAAGVAVIEAHGKQVGVVRKAGSSG